MIEFGCIVSAAGQGLRLGGGMPKALVPLAGTPMLVHALRTVIRQPDIVAVVVVAPPDRVVEVEDLMTPIGTDRPLTVVAGGAQRSDSVRAGMAALPARPSGVLVHDAARPFVPDEVFARVMAAVSTGAPAAIPGLAVTDTIKQVDDTGFVVATPNRAHLRAIQTPQGFARDVLHQALAQPEADATDDAGLVERLGLPVRVVPGHGEGFKVTSPADLVIAEQWAERRSPHVR